MSAPAIRPSRQLHSGGRWFHGAPIVHADWDPRGRRLLSQSEGAVKVWWAATGELIGSLAGIGGDATTAGRFVFLPDGRRIAGAVVRGNRASLRYWDVEELSLAGEVGDGAGEICARDRERRLAIVCAGSENRVALVDLESGSRIAALDTTEAIGSVPEYCEILAAAIRPDGARVFLHRRNSVPETPGPIVTDTFELWDAATQTLLKKSRPSADTTSACWDQAGRRIVVAGEGATILDGETLQPLGRLDQVPSFVPRLHTDPSGARIAAAHGRIARLYSGEALAPEARYLPIAGAALAFSPDGAAVLSGGESGLLVATELATGKPIGDEREIPQADFFTGGVDRTVSFTRDGSTLAVGRGTAVTFHDGKTLDAQRLVEWAKATDADRALWRRAEPNTTPDLTLAATYWPYDRGRDGEPHGVLVYGPRGAMFDLVHQITDGRAGSVAVSPDGVLAASGHSTATLRLWELATALERRALLVPPGEASESVAAVAFSLDGTLVAAGDRRGAVHVWRCADGVRIAHLHSPPDAPVTALAFGPRGLLAVGRSGPRSNLTLLDPDGRTVAVLAGHASDVTSLAFHPDGTRLVSAGRDRCVFVWTLPA